MEIEARIPESFPGTVAIVDNKAERTILHPQYRRYKNGYDADFEYFVTQILAKLNPLRTNFRTRKKKSDQRDFHYFRRSVCVVCFVQRIACLGKTEGTQRPRIVGKRFSERKKVLQCEKWKKRSVE